MHRFAIATLLPLVLIALSAFHGGVCSVVALLGMTLVIAALDELVARANAGGAEREFPAADALSVVLALGQLALIVLLIRALPRAHLTGAEKLATFAAAGLYLGQVGNSNAHELIHRGGRWLHGLGVAAYVSVLFGHHASAHVLVHHVRVATRADPSTARAGEGLYRFVGRAWRGSFREGWRAEAERLTRIGRPLWRHPYGVYLGGAGLAVVLAVVLGGPAGLGWYLALAAFAQVQLLMSDYVQHYGLMRATGAQGRPVPVGPRHSWNSPHQMSSALMLNAPRHSDHHSHPARPYPALALPAPDMAPRLPRSLPVMACLALVPPLWRRVMDSRAAVWGARG